MIEHFYSDNISHSIFVNVIASMNHFATSKVAFWLVGTCWFALVSRCGSFLSPLAYGSGGAHAGGPRSDLHTSVRRAECCRWNSGGGGAVALAGFREFGFGGHAMTVSAGLHFFHTETLVLWNDLSRRAKPSSRTSGWWSIASSLISGAKVDSAVSTLSTSSISWLGLSFFINEIRDICHLQYNAQRQRAGKWNIWSTMNIGCFLASECKCSLKVCFLILLKIVIPHLAGCRFHLLEWR